MPWVPKMPVVEGVAPGSHKADWMGGGSGRVRIFESGVVSCIRLVSHRNSQASMRVDTSGLGKKLVQRLFDTTEMRGDLVAAAAAG